MKLYSLCLILFSSFPVALALMLKHVHIGIVGSDYDEKFGKWCVQALMAIRNVMQLETSQGNAVLKELCELELDFALERMRQQLIDRSKTGEEYQKDYTMDLEILRSQVDVMFHTKLGKATPVTT